MQLIVHERYRFFKYLKVKIDVWAMALRQEVSSAPYQGTLLEMSNFTLSFQIVRAPIPKHIVN